VKKQNGAVAKENFCDSICGRSRYRKCFRGCSTAKPGGGATTETLWRHPQTHQENAIMLARKTSYFVIPLVAMVLMACGTINIGFNGVRGSGNVVSEERAVSGFEKVALQGSGDLYIEQGSQEGLTIEAEDNLMEYITTEVRGNELVIGFKQGTSVQPTRGIRYNLKVKNLNNVSLSGSGNILADSFGADTLRLAVSGSGDVKVSDLQAAELDIVSSGSGRFEISGEVQTADITFSGSGKYFAENLKTNDTSITIGGSGEATVWASSTLSVQISGSGDIGYYGQPQITQSISGSGDIKNLGEK
jgi:hypothetical protein